MEFRVAPNLASFGGADWPASGLPPFPVLRYRRRSSLRVAPLRDLPAPSGDLPSSPGVAPSGFALVGFTELPRFLFPLARRRANFKVTLNLRSLGVAAGLIGELPRSSYPRLLPSLASRVAPGPHLRLVDDESPAGARTLHPRLAPLMNLRVQRVRHFLPGSRCSLNLLCVSPPASWLRCLTRPIVLLLPDRSCCPIPYRVIA